MISSITSQVMKKAPYIGPIFQGVGVAMDLGEILEDSTPLGAAKIVASRLAKECTPPEIFLASCL